MKEQPTRILYINGGIMNRGGIEANMMNYYRHIDREKIQIDFVVHGNERGVYDDEIEALGGQIFRVPKWNRNYLGNVKALEKIISTKKYLVIHAHLDAMSIISLKIAKKNSVPIRIAHSHNTKHLTNKKLSFIIQEYGRRNIKKYATHLFACSQAAGEWLYGEEAVLNNQVTVINNAIELNRFVYNKNIRDSYRKEFGFNEEFIIGHVGRFDYQKNHSFLIEIFREAVNYIPEAKLVLIGTGHLKKNVEKQVEDNNLDKNVIFLGSRTDVPELMNCFDLFLFPSLFEGLPFAVIEAQVNGLKCIVSNTVSQEVDITKNVKFVDLNLSAKEWAEEINVFSSNKRIIDKTDLENSGYDIINEALKLQENYLDMIEKLNEV